MLKYKIVIQYGHRAEGRIKFSKLAHNYDCDLLHYKLKAFIIVKLMFYN